ncbi:AraC family transcriptional regulator [Saccharibacillus sp. CPCC 101409]|uniref:helix-turn-helix domain-containing protein n=1 Tax=Saccharibacillus sp. CPCC 101409 TaxID=3058041 RepID=UPI00267100C8|nr:AraC family transcriptional regulator [Saccharibacillus sp. CPCC 101409]MDO3413351.1 AraC family transcriptional regulator [Saccharibacillus sp. CPCC 101409]
MSSVYLNWFTTDNAFPFFIQYGGHDEDMDLHRHVDFSELVIVLSGNARHIVNDEESFIKKGNAFVINGTTAHAYKEPHDFKICNIMYRPEMLAAAGPDLRISTGFQALFVLQPLYSDRRARSDKLSLPMAGVEHVGALIAAMIGEYEQKLQGYQTMLIARFMELVVYLCRNYDTQSREAPDSLTHLANAVSFMEDHYLEPLTLEQIASQAGISVRHLNRMFKAYYRTTPVSYLQSLRLERSRMLLKRSDLPVTQISYECGFNDSNYFTRQFTKAYGMPPKAYRQRLSHQ